MITREEAVEIRYLGWSSVELTYPDGVRVYVDPHFSSFDGEILSGSADYQDPDLYLVTHGHFDHCQDVPALARTDDGLVVTSPPLERFFVRNHGLAPTRVHGIGNGHELEHAGLRVSSQGWTHRILRDRWPALLARKPGGILRMRHALRCFLSSPLLGFRIDSGRTPPVTIIGEAFQSPLDLDRVRELGSRSPAGVTLVALEPGLEGDIARAVAAFGPAVVLVYSGHAPMWNYFGLPPVDFSLFQRTLGEPGVSIPVHVLEPRSRVRIAREGIVA